MLKTITKLMAAGFYAALILCSSQAMAGAKLEVDETKWWTSPKTLENF